jgi:hypothetical protein
MYSLARFWKHSPRTTSNQAPDPDPGAAAKDPHVAPARSTFQCIQAIHVIRDSCSMRTATVHARRLRTAKQAASLPNFITWPPHHLLEDVRWLTVRPLMSMKHVSVTRMHSTFSSLSRQSGSLPFYKARVLVHTVTLKKKLTIIAFSALPHVARLRGSLVHRWSLLPGSVDPTALAANLILVLAHPHVPIANDSVHTRSNLELEELTEAAGSCPQSEASSLVERATAETCRGR